MAGVTRALTFAAVVLFWGQAHAYDVSTTTGGKEIKWSTPGMSYYFNASGAPADALAAVQAALQTWNDVPTSNFTFTSAGSTTSTAFGDYDQVNIIGFGSLSSTSILAQNTFWYSTATGNVLDSDIEFNTKQTWSTTGSSTAYDVQNVGVHELGHALSLSDLYSTADSEKTMYGYASKGETKKRTLDQDDIDGISYLYPGSDPVATAVGLVGDFDGDGRADLTEYYTAAGNWYINYSGGGSLLGYNMGWSETTPVPGDFDGDGRTDMAVYHQAAGNWYIAYSGGGYLIGYNMGWSEAVPVPGDYDGDGRTDMAVYYQAAGKWYIAYSSGGYLIGYNMGWSEAIPVPGDYDGDGRTDMAVYHQEAGNWYIAYSSGGYLIGYNMGWSETTPVAGDYDGDGRTDMAVYHQATGDWYIAYSGGGYLIGGNIGWR